MVLIYKKWHKLNPNILKTKTSFKTEAMELGKTKSIFCFFVNFDSKLWFFFQNVGS